MLPLVIGESFVFCTIISLSHQFQLLRLRPSCAHLSLRASAEGCADGGCAWRATWRYAPIGPRIDNFCPDDRLSPAPGIRAERAERTCGALHARWSGVA